MKIIDVNAYTIRIPLDVPKRFATRTAYYRDYSIVNITTDAGINGWGYCWGLSAVTYKINHLLKNLLIGENPINISRLWNKMYTGTEVWGRRGVTIRAISAVDIALWDILGKFAKLPISKLIGGYRDEVKAYYSGGYYPEPYTKDEEFLSYIQEEMEIYKEKGFTSFKMKVGGGSEKLDLKRIEVARKVIGDDAELMVDANNVWDYSTAIRMGKAMDEYNIKWLEEPVPIDDIIACAKVNEALDVPIAIGENHFTRWEFKNIINEKAADIIQADPTLTGGITEWLKIANIAAIEGIQLAPHWTHDVNVHVGLGIKEVTHIEYFELEGDVFNFQAVLENPIIAVNGYVKSHDTPGHGLILNKEAVKQYLHDE